MKRWIAVVVALSAGEVAGLFLGGAFASPVVALIAAALVFLLGYGGNHRSWPYLLVVVLGLFLSSRVAVSQEHRFRDKFWLRDRAQAEKGVTGLSSPCARRIRADLCRRAGLGLDESRLALRLNRAILLGERSALSSDTKRIFADAGTMHVFAVSGLHVMMVANVMIALLSLLLVPVRWSGVLVLPALWGYVYVIGAPPSAVRAAGMASVCFLAPLFFRQPDWLVAWCVTFVVAHVVDPARLTDVGNLLSFAVMLAILVWMRLMRGETRRWLIVLGCTVVAWAASVPIVASVFARFTIGGLLANLLLLPVAACCIVTGMLGILASFVSDALAAHLNNLAALLTDAMTAISAATAGLPCASVTVVHWSVARCVAWYVMLAVALALVSRSARSASVAWLRDACQRRQSSKARLTASTDAA